MQESALLERTSAFRQAVPASPSGSAASPAAAVRALFGETEADIDFARVAIAIDGVVDPATDAAATLAEVDGLTEAARQLAKPFSSEERTLAAVRTVLHLPGPWNGGRPFRYDREAFTQPALKLISNYLRTRLGNCVSMPILFLILADRLGIDIGLALAPSHLFVRVKDPSGGETNLETTSGALPARDGWLRQERGISDRSIATGLYLRKLGRRESVAAMALTVVDHLIAERRYEEALQATEVILRHSPRNAFAMAHQGQACFQLASKCLEKYRSAFLIPPQIRPRYDFLLRRNRQV